MKDQHEARIFAVRVATLVVVTIGLLLQILAIVLK